MRHAVDSRNFVQISDDGESGSGLFVAKWAQLWPSGAILLKFIEVLYVLWGDGQGARACGCIRDSCCCALVAVVRLARAPTDSDGRFFYAAYVSRCSTATALLRPELAFWDSCLQMWF